MQLAQSLIVHNARDFVVTEGANFGDPMGEISQLAPSDVYQLRRDASKHRVLITRAPDGHAVIAPDCPSGHAGLRVRVLGDLTLMSPYGNAPCPAILLAGETVAGDHVATWLFSFGILHENHPYSLIHANPGASRALLGQLGSASFVSGTQVMMERGGQRPIETLHPGDLVMTRSHGPRPIRDTRAQTLRAEGVFAPIVLSKGVLNVSHDLWLSPQHRLFVYQRQDHMGIGRKELTVQAEMLVNGIDIIQKPGGFLEYHELVFDQPEIIFVNGIAAESRFAPILGEGETIEELTPAPAAAHLKSGDFLRPLDHHRLRAASRGIWAPRPV